MNQTILLRFDQDSPHWCPGGRAVKKYNVLFVENALTRLSNRFDREGYLTLSDVMFSLGLKPSPADTMIGWVKSETDKINFEVTARTYEITILLTTEHEFDPEVDYKKQRAKEVIF